MSAIELNTFQPDRDTVLYVCNEESNYLTVRVDALKNHLNLFKDLQELPDREPLNVIRSTRFKKETLQTLIRFVEGRETTLAITPNNVIEMLEAMDYFDIPKVWEYFSTPPKQLVAVLKEMEANLNAVERKKLESIQNKVIKILSNNNCQKALQILSNWMVPSDQRDRVFHPVITRLLKTCPVDEGIRIVARYTFGKERKTFYLDRIQFDTKTLHGLLRNFLKTLALGEDLKSCPKYQQFAKNLETITGYDFLKLMSLLPNKKELWPYILHPMIKAVLDMSEDQQAEFLRGISNALKKEGSEEVNALKSYFKEAFGAFKEIEANAIAGQMIDFSTQKNHLEIILEHKNLTPIARMSETERKIYLLQKMTMRAINTYEENVKTLKDLRSRKVTIMIGCIIASAIVVLGLLAVGFYVLLKGFKLDYDSFADPFTQMFRWIRVLNHLKIGFGFGLIGLGVAICIANIIFCVKVMELRQSFEKLFKKIEEDLVSFSL